MAPGFVQHGRLKNDAWKYPLDVRTAIELGIRFGYHIPENIHIYAVEIKDNTTFSETLTPEVEKPFLNL